MYSLMSILIKESSDSNMNLAKTFANSVLPTPVGPRNIKDPIGFLGSFKPARVLRMALANLIMASSCPII